MFFQICAIIYTVHPWSQCQCFICAADTFWEVIFILIITNLVTVEKHNTKYLKRGAYLLLSEWKTTLRKQGTRDLPLVSTW